MAYVNVLLNVPNKGIEDLRAMVDYPHPTQMRKILALLLGLLNGAYRGFIRTTLCSERSSATITGTAAGVAPGDLVVIAGTTLTNAASPANENEFADSAVTATLAANLAAAINVHSVLSKIVFAVVTTAASGIVTVYSKYPGPIGNLITLTETGGYTVSAAALAGGAGDEVDDYARGYDPATALAG